MMALLNIFCHDCCVISLIICCYFVCATRAADKMTCYQCDVERNEDCNEEFLRPCPDDQAYDRCMTRISRSKSEGYSISKKCALGPCNLRDEVQSSGLGLDDNCDRRKEEFLCIGCCKGHGCNTDTASNFQGFGRWTLLFIAALVLILTRSFCRSGDGGGRRKSSMA